MSKTERSSVFEIPIPNAVLVSMSPDATGVLSYHPPFLHLHRRPTLTHQFRLNASIRIVSVSALSLREGAFFGTRNGSLFFGGFTLKPRLVASLPGKILAVSHTRTFFAAAIPSSIFVIRGKKIVYKFSGPLVSALSLAEWHAIGETARSASLAYVAGGKIVYIPDISDGCVGVQSVEGVRSVYVHQGRSKDFVYALGNRLRVYETDMTGRLRPGESFRVHGLTCAEWVQERGRRTFIVASIGRDNITITATKILKRVRFGGEQVKRIHTGL